MSVAASALRPTGPAATDASAPILNSFFMQVFQTAPVHHDQDEISGLSADLRAEASAVDGSGTPAATRPRLRDCRALMTQRPCWPPMPRPALITDGHTTIASAFSRIDGRDRLLLDVHRLVEDRRRLAKTLSFVRLGRIQRPDRRESHTGTSARAIFVSSGLPPRMSTRHALTTIDCLQETCSEWTQCTPGRPRKPTLMSEGAEGQAIEKATSSAKISSLMRRQARDFRFPGTRTAHSAPPVSP